MAKTAKIPEWVDVSTQFTTSCGKNVRVKPARGGKSLQLLFYYLDPEGERQHYQLAGYKNVAEAIKEAEEVLKANREQVDVRKSNSTTVDQLGQLYLTYQRDIRNREPRTLRNIDLAFRRISRYIGHIKLWDLTHYQVDRAQAKLTKLDKDGEPTEEPLALGTLQAYMIQIHAALKWAYNKDLAKENLALKAEMPRLSKDQKKAKRVKMWVPDDDDMNRIFAAQASLPGTKERVLHEVISEYFAHTGTRIGEALNLCLERMDPEAQTQQVGIKSAAGYRTIRLDPELWQALLRLQDRWHTVEEMEEGQLVKRTYVFVQQNGEVPDGATIRRRLKQVAKHLGLPNLKPHLFRHYSAHSILRTKGGSLQDIKDNHGHSKISVSSDYYLHLQVNDRTDKIMAEGSKRIRKAVALQKE